MILRRIGNKQSIAAKIQKYFPPHDTYIEPFFGAGGMFFNKPKATHNIVNDIDGDVYNLFWVLMDRPEELRRGIELMPKHYDLLQHWKENKETDPIRKAMRFLFLSNYTFMGKMGTLRLSKTDKKILLKNFDATRALLSDVQFHNADFHVFLKSFQYQAETTFAYCDPPYIGTADNYSDSFTKNDTIDLIETLLKMGIRFAISEFKNDVVIELAKAYNLNLIEVCEKRTLESRNIEVLLTNYRLQKTLFDFD